MIYCDRIPFLKTVGIGSMTARFFRTSIHICFHIPVHFFIPLLSNICSNAWVNFCRRGHDLYPYPMRSWWGCGYLCRPCGTFPCNYAF